DNQILQRIICDNQFASLSNITDSLSSRLNTTLHYNTVRKYIYNESLDLNDAKKNVNGKRNRSKRYNQMSPDCIQPTVKFDGESIMFWGCFGWHKVRPLVVVEGSMNSDDYINILSNSFIPWISNYPSYIFSKMKHPVIHLRIVFG
ncbi:15989_t:CDS:2, partial [Funneliformis geosporum]